jgi:dCMP deaminase
MTTESELRAIIKPIAFMKMADNLSKLSYDPKHKVGSLIIKNDWTEINSMGYNGSYSGSPNKRTSLESGKSNFIHAEMNALILSTLSREEAAKYTLYVTMTPCETCSRLIVNKGIKRVIALNVYDNCGDTLEVFKKSNVEFNYIHDLIKKLYKESSLYNESYSFIEKADGVDDIYNLMVSQLKRFFETSNKTIDLQLDDFNNISDIDILHQKYIDCLASNLYKLI